MHSASIDTFLRTDFNSPISSSNKKLLDEQDIVAEAFGHVFSLISTVGYSILDVSSRVLTKLDGIDKLFKFMSGGILFVIVRFERLKKSLPESLEFMQDRLSLITNTFSGFNIVSRINDFTKCVRDNDGNPRVALFYQDTSWKIGNRVLLTVVNLCDTIKMIQNWGGKEQIAALSLKMSQVAIRIASVAPKMDRMAVMASKLGQTETFKFVSDLGFQNWFVVGSSLCSIVDAAKSLSRERNWKDSLTLTNEILKISLIFIPPLWGVNTYARASLTMINSCISLSKIAYDDYTNHPRTSH